MNYLRCLVGVWFLFMIYNLQNTISKLPDQSIGDVYRPTIGVDDDNKRNLYNEELRVEEVNSKLQNQLKTVKNENEALQRRKSNS